MAYRLLPESSSSPPQKSAEITGQKVKDALLESVRFPVRQAVNVTGALTGLPGDVLSLVNNYVAGPIAEKISGQPAIPYEQTTVGKIIPTSSQTKGALQSIAPEFLKPKNSLEDFVDMVVEDTALLFSPAKTKIPFAGTANKFNKLLKPFYVSLGANIVGKGVEDFSGGDKEKAAKAKIGSMFLFSVIDRKRAAQYASELYKEAEKAIPKGAKADASALEHRLNGLKHQMSQGTKAPSEQFVIDEADAILKKVKNGEIGVEEAWASKRSLNEKLNDHLYKNPDKASQARARKKAGEIQHELSDLLEKYGDRNAKFGKNFESAEEAFSTLAKSRFITKFINKNLNYNPKTSGLLHLLGSAAGGALANTVGAGGTGTIVAAGAYPTAKLGYRIVKSPTLRKHYANVVKAAASENAAAFNRELQRLDEAIQKEQSKQKFRLLD